MINPSLSFILEKVKAIEEVIDVGLGCIFHRPHRRMTMLN